MKRLVLALSIGAGLLGCGLSEQSQSRSLEEPLETQGENLHLSDSEWVGTGRLLMQSQLRSPRDAYHVRLKGQFLEETSIFIVHLFLDNFQYNTGIQLRFSLEDNQIDVEVAEPGMTYRHLTHLENSMTSDLRFDLRIEAYNDLSSEQRILLWNNQVQMNSENVQPRDKILVGNADFDSSQESFVFFEWGKGYHWGLSIEKMRIEIFKRETPFVFN